MHIENNTKPMKRAGFEFREHTADVQVRSWGTSLEEAFAQTAYSLIATITPDLRKINPNIERFMTIEAEDKEALLFDFLSEFLYIFDVEELVFSKILVNRIEKIDNNYKLEATLRGEKFDSIKHEIGIEVKAITYSFLNIEEKLDNIVIDIVFDI
jgi:SHS2 domain-containing protein